MRAILLDCLGTLVRLEPPAPRLRAELRRVAGVDVGEEAAEAAVRAEIAYYVGHHLEGRDSESLAGLRARCAEAMRGGLGEAGAGLDGETAVRVLLGSLRFTPYPDAAPALRRLRSDGVRLVAVSNWDCSLDEVLGAAGLGELLDGAVSSAAVGEAKPAPAVFRAGLRAAGAEAGEAIHVGDSLENDVAGARAAGIEPVLLVRDGAPPGEAAGLATVHTLAELPDIAFARARQ